MWIYNYKPAGKISHSVEQMFGREVCVQMILNTNAYASVSVKFISAVSVTVVG